MLRRAVLTSLVVAVALALPGSAQAALNDVHLGGSPGTFYFDDASVGDGKVEITQGDQLRFVADDGGQPGRPHSAKVDGLPIDSGNLSRGQTYTTPPIDQAGAFKLYCKLHEQAGHWTTLVVRSNGTAPPVTTTTTAAAGPTTTVKGTAKTTTTTSAAGGTVSTTPSAAAGEDGTTDDSTDTTLAPTGLGEVSRESLIDRPVDPR